MNVNNTIFTIFFISLLCFAAFAVFSDAYPYSLPFHVSNNTASPIGINGVSLTYAGTCQASLSQKMTATGSSYSITTSLYSPGSVNIGTGTLTGQNNITCKTLATATGTTSLNGNYEGRSAITHGGTTLNATITNEYNCDTGASIWFNEEIVPWRDVDSNGNVPGRLFEWYDLVVTGTPKTHKEVTDLILGTYDVCFSELQPTPAATLYGGCSGTCTDNTPHGIWFYPFNSTQGYVNYSISQYNGTSKLITITDNCAGGDLTANITIFLIDVAAESYNVLHSSTANVDIGTVGSFWSGSLSLDKNKIYVIAVGVYFDYSGSHISCNTAGTAFEPSINISSFVYTADWDCSDWSDCTETTQTQTCTDPAGIAPPEIRYRTCGVTILENATIGFEEYTTENDVYKCVPNWIPGCNYAITTISRDVPTGWNVHEENASFKMDYLTMSADWASEGSRSLKMWFINPAVGRPIDTLTCGNSTVGYVPYMNTTISNDTFSVTYNVTFPSEFMRLRFDVKGCSEQVEHNGIMQNWLFTACPRTCYSSNCSTMPNAQYQVYIRDASGVLIATKQASANNYKKQTIGIDLKDLSVGINYSILLSARPESLNSQDGNCVMFDNIRYEVLAEERAVSCVAGEICDGTTLIKTEYNSYLDSCSYEEIKDGCLSGDDKDRFDALLDYCSDDITLRTFDYDIGDWVSRICAHCYNNECLTDDEYINVTASEIPNAPETLDDLFMVVFSVSFLLSAALMVLCIFVVLFIPSGGQAWPLALFGVAQFVFVCSISGLIPIYFAVAEIVLAVAIIAFFISKTGGG